MTDVPFFDLAAAHQEVAADLDAAIARVRDRDWYIKGEEVTAFEEEFAAACGVSHAVGTGNGLDSLRLALLAKGIGHGDEVIVPSHTFIATWLAVSQTGAQPIPVEPDLGTMLIDSAGVAAAITPATKAVIPVHLYGRPVDMGPIMDLAEERDLFVLEDAAQAHGAMVDGAPTGGLAHAAAFSFYPGKNLGALGDAGAVTTADGDLAACIRELGDYGQSARYHHRQRGVNSRLDEIQAACLRVKLPRLQVWNQLRQEHARTYLTELAGLAELSLPPADDRIRSAWHLFVIRHGNRDALMKHLAEQGIATQVHYPIACHDSEAYKVEMEPLEFPMAAHLAARVLSLPIGPHLSAEQCDQVIAAVHTYSDSEGG